MDATVLGAFEVDQEANVANWIVPGGKQLGVGGAMDLVSGANTVVIAMTHTSRGKPKLIPSCTLPITGRHEADIVVTELGVFAYSDGVWTLKKLAPDTTLEELKGVTALAFEVPETVDTMIV